MKKRTIFEYIKKHADVENLSSQYIETYLVGLKPDIEEFYQALDNIRHKTPEAAEDLGANSFTVFMRVILPLSVPGIISGVTMVLLPSMTNYVVLDMLYNSTYIMGSLIGSYFATYDWNNGSMISLILLIIIFIITLATNRFNDSGDAAGRTIL